jgi:hypothetical protein
VTALISAIDKIKANTNTI